MFLSILMEHLNITTKLKKVFLNKGAARVLKDMDYPEEIIKTIENS